MNNNGTGPHVLIVEDDNSLRDLFSEALESDGFKTSIASNGAEGIQMFDEVNPDLVLLDLLMPKMDGWEALERVRKISECPVIIVAGQGTTEDIIRGLLESGADDYLVKPFGIKELIARVNAVLRRATPAA
jgi:DNA-binding response OmpR family regulator